MNRQELHACISKNQPNICQIAAYQNGKEVYSDEWHEYKPEDTCHLMSARKYRFLLVGIAIDQGVIQCQ